jgi:hypothetical protein
MKKKNLLVKAVVVGVLLCSSVVLAQDPVQNIDPRLHPNLAQAQQLVVEAYRHIQSAQKENGYDMRGHASKARQLLYQANQEMKAAAEDANAYNAQHKR